MSDTPEIRSVSDAFRSYSDEDKAVLTSIHEELKKSIGTDLSRSALIKALEPNLVTPDNLLNR